MTELYLSPMKTAVSLPDAVFRAADRLAQRRKISRSELYAEALQAYLAAADRENVTERLNDVYEEVDQPLDPFTDEAARRAIERNEW